MPQSRSVFVLLVAIVLSVSFAVPSEDDPKTTYDESASVPYISARLVSPAGREPTVEAQFVANAGSERVAEAPALWTRPSRIHLAPLRRSATQLCDEGRGWDHRVFDSLTILDHTLRC